MNFEVPENSIDIPNLVLPTVPNHDIPFQYAQPSHSLNDLATGAQPYFELDSLIEDTSELSASPLTLRSSRSSKLPVYLYDYHCHLKTNSVTPSVSCFTSHPLQNYFLYDRLSPSYRSFILNVSFTYESQTFQQAVQFDHWQDAMQNELNVLESNHIQTITPLPKGAKPVGYKWVYKVKLNANDIVERYKARLVAKGYT